MNGAKGQKQGITITVPFFLVLMGLAPVGLATLTVLLISMFDSRTVTDVAVFGRIAWATLVYFVLLCVVCLAAKFLYGLALKKTNPVTLRHR